MDLAWIIIPPSKGSGGFRTICSKAAYMERYGVRSTFFILPGSFFPKGPNQVAREIEAWFGYSCEVAVSAEVPSTFDAVVATAWNTAEFAARQKCPHKLYFIQDYEPWFSPMGEDFLLAEQSYSLGLEPITIGRWLSRAVAIYYGKTAPFCDFGADLGIYRPRADFRIPKTVCAIFQPEKGRRLSGILRDAIELMLAANGDVQFYLYGGECPEFQGHPQVHALGVIAVDELADLYSKCSLGISISASNPSRLPFEMMASGLPVLEIVKENNAYDFPVEAMVFAEPSPEGIASACLAALEDPALLRGMSDAGLRFMRGRDLSNENEMFYRSVLSYISTDGATCLPEVCKNDLSPLGIDEGLLHLREELEFSKWNELAKSQAPVYGRGINVHFQALADANRIFKVAWWTKPDQSDVTWTVLRRREGAFCCELLLPEALDEALLYMHFYSFNDEEDDPLFLGGIEQLVTTIVTSGAADTMRSYSFNGNMVALCFRDASQRALLEGGTTSYGGQFLLFGKSLLNRLRALHDNG